VEHEGPPSNVIGFLGSKGGVGTTTLVVNAAVALAQSNARDRQVVLVELRDGLAAQQYKTIAEDLTETL
jgi:Mrp family chromosome partitioning ATPase